ncbi:MAG: GspE/PulE family protein [Bacteroidota bacterium]
MGASDIHLERYEAYARVRFRWEGKLLEKYTVSPAQYNAIVSRLKILSELDIAEKRLPQDGRMQLVHQDQVMDVRVSTIPGKFGEKVVLRLLNRSVEFLQLENLGMREKELALFQQSIQQPNGIILITGPTGSGKTTTLYAALNQLNRTDRNITTIEDPIEYNLPGINQVQLKPEIGLDFERALRAFLRQDPDIIMVGEIRDEATASIAIRAALTGHLVLSTLHTNSSLDVIHRLTDMGVAPYLIPATLRLSVAQRLVRLLCPHCKSATQEVSSLRLPEELVLKEHYLPVGCPRCNFTGYHRRTAIYEMLPIRPETEAFLQQDRTTQRASLPTYFPDFNSLRDQAFRLVQAGETSLEEVYAWLI